MENKGVSLGEVVGIVKAIPGSAAAAAIAAQTAAETAQAAAEQVAESIPQDYSAMSADVAELKSAVEELQAGSLSALDADKGQVPVAEGDGTWNWGHSENYVTPEMFGAAGDNTTDDTQAIQDCIDYAKTHKKGVRGYNKYKTTGTVAISGSYQDIEILAIVYTGTDYALTLTGSYSNIKLIQLDASNGQGLKCITGCSYNKVSIMRLYAKSHCVSFDASSGMILYNTFDIRVCKSDTGNCFNNISGQGECVFMNTTCSCVSGWAIYDCRGRFYNFTLEGSVLNGIYVDHGTAFFEGFRIREMVDKIVYQINGNTSYTGGTLIKFSSNSTGNCIVRFISEDFVPYEAIDVSDMKTVGELSEESPTPYNYLANTAYYSVIDAPIRNGNWDTHNGYIMSGKRMLVAAGLKILVPAYETMAIITSADYDMRDAQNILNDAKIYPTKFVIGVDDCVIHLPTSYCAYGYSEFVIDQTHGHLCTIYDCRNDSIPIFNGVTFGNGVYRLKAYCKPTDNAVKDVLQNPPDFINLNDTVNYSWVVENVSGGRSGIVSVAEYGAIGDGTTDDSVAVQKAINENYDVYFESGKTYYLGSAVEVTGDRKLHGGLNTIIKTTTPSSGEVNKGLYIHGTLKATTTLTTDYKTYDSTDNSANKITLTDMTEVEIGDILVIKATDQYYAYSRNYYYLGAVLLVTDKYDGHLYVNVSMPFDITLTNNVSVEVYSAPEVHIENLHFISDHDSFENGTYNALVDMNYCKNSTIKDCTFTEFVMGIYFRNCVNCLAEDVSMSKSKWDNTEVNHDGYGLSISSCTNTVIRRMVSLCSQSCVDLTGQVPNINTYIFESNLASEARAVGIGSHENAYNTVVEDCTIAGMNCYGTVTVNRCKFIKNNRVPSSTAGINFRGTYRADWARLNVSNCVFDGQMGINIMAPDPQNGVQAFNNMIDSILITNCQGGALSYTPSTSASILSNNVETLEIDHWNNCTEIHNAGTNRIGYLKVNDCTFTKHLWINDHNDSHGIVTSGIERVEVFSSNPMAHKMLVNRTTYGECQVLPENIQVTFTQNDVTDEFRICGANLVSDDAQDYAIGTVSGNTGGPLSRTPASGSANPTFSIDSSGNIIYTQNNNTTTRSLYSKFMFWVGENCNITVSTTVKNTGNTTGEKFRIYLRQVDPKTGLVSGTNNSSLVEASAAGETMSLTVNNIDKKMVLVSIYCSTAVSGAETTFENLTITVTPRFAPAPTVTEAYKCKRLTGSGTLTSYAGVNNIMASVNTFGVSYGVDYLQGLYT